MYQLQRDKNTAMLIAKAGTPQLANYVIVDAIFEHRNGFNGNAINYGPFDVISTLDKLHLCSSIVKVNEGEEKFVVQANGSAECAYSHPEQIYYFHTIN